MFAKQLLALSTDCLTPHKANDPFCLRLHFPMVEEQKSLV